MIAKLITILIGTAILLSAVDLTARGLDVAPAKYNWQDVPVGRKVEMPVAIQIRNKSKAASSYTLRAVQPAAINTGVDQGYTALPSAGWVTFDHKHIVINPGETVKVKVYLHIPPKPAYRNRHWQFFVEVKEHSELGNMFSLACYPKFSIQTAKTLSPKQLKTNKDRT